MAADDSENALVVKAFAYPTTDLGQRPDDPGVQPLPGVQVAISNGGPRPCVPREPTGPDGQVRFENLPEDGAVNYRSR